MEELRDGFNSFQVVPDAEVFIGRVDSVAVETKTHQDGLAAEFSFKKSYYRDAATASLRNRCFSEGFFIGFFRCPVSDVVDRSDIGLAAVMGFYFYGYSFGGYGFKVLLKQAGYFLPVLIRHQAHADFCKSL